MTFLFLCDRNTRRDQNAIGIVRIDHDIKVSCYGVYRASSLSGEILRCSNCEESMKTFVQVYFYATNTKIASKMQKCKNENCSIFAAKYSLKMHRNVYSSWILDVMSWWGVSKMTSYLRLRNFGRKGLIEKKKKRRRRRRRKVENSSER